MSPFITYLINAGVIYFLFFLLYWILFRRETFFKRNRIYLLMSLVLPALIPLISFPVNSSLGGLVSEQGRSLVMIFDTVKGEPSSLTGSLPLKGPLTDPGKAGPGSILLFVYLAGTVFFLFRLIFSYSRLIRLIASSTSKPFYEMILVITRKVVSPFSIFKWLVIPHTKENHPDLDKIVSHEMVHFKQKHSYDLLLTELVLAFQWFNPFVWMLKSSVVKNNEFLVDQILISENFDQKEYQYALLSNSVGQTKMAMVNGFSKGLIKKRITMMNKRKTRLVNRAKEIILIPFALMLVLVFSAYTNIAEEIPQDKQRKKIEKDSWTIKKDSDTRVVSERRIVGGDTWTVEQDQDKKKKEKKSEKEHVTIMIDGKMLTLKDASGLVDKEGDIKIIKLSDLKDQEGESISRKKLIERIEEIKSEDENTIIMIKESEEGEDEVDIYALVSGVSSSLKEGPIYLKKEKDGSIEISTTAGDSKVMYISGSEGDKKKIHIRTDGKGEDFLILIDDKISSEEALNDLDADKIYSIEILDSEEAKKEFGDKAKDGVIKVKTKK